MCWRFTSATAPDRRPTYSWDPDKEPCPDLPVGWDDYDCSDNNVHESENSSFWKKHKNEPIQLLRHYSKAPSGLPVDDYTAIPAEQVANGRWYLGVFSDEASAKAVAHSLNRLTVKPQQYHSGHGPVQDGGWVVIRSMPGKKAPFIANPPQVLSCVDPFKDLTDAIFVLEMFHVDGLRGTECLERFEKAQQTESLARPRADVDKLVSTHAGHGLTIEQVEHARDLWSLKLRLKIKTKVTEDAARERNQVVCDDVDEMPNMATVA